MIGLIPSNITRNIFYRDGIFYPKWTEAQPNDTEEMTKIRQERGINSILPLFQKREKNFVRGDGWFQPVELSYHPS